MDPKFSLYCDNQLIGHYPTRQALLLDAFELMLDGLFQTFEITENL